MLCILTDFKSQIKHLSMMIYVLTEGRMRILQVTGLQIPLTRVVNIWKKKDKTVMTTVT